MPLPSNFFSVNSYGQKFMAFKFGNDIFIIFKMPRSSFLMSVGKMTISLLFRPSASEVLEVGKSVRKVRKGKIKKNDDVLNTQVAAL